MQPEDHEPPPHRPTSERQEGDHGAARPDYGQAGHLAGSRGPTSADRARKAAGAGRRAATSSGRAAGRAAGGALRVARKVSHAEGAGESGLSRIIELHAFNAGGDTALAISLAGTLFFQVPSGEARNQIALFLGITMLPFAVLAPLIGPFLDRFSRGRRWSIGATMALRAFGAWALAGAV
ncbi:MAG: MFS transporter, partial [Nocardioidaceae bacterium]